MTVQRPAFRHTVALRMDGYKERLADNIRQAREAKSIGRGEVADKVGVSPRTVERWEEATSKPHLSTLMKLAELFEVEVSDLRPDTPPDFETLERIEAKLDLLLDQAGLPVDFDSIADRLRTRIAQAGRPQDATRPHSGEPQP